MYPLRRYNHADHRVRQNRFRWLPKVTLSVILGSFYWHHLRWMIHLQHIQSDLPAVPVINLELNDMPVFLSDPCQEKRRLVEILLDAGYPPRNLTTELCHALPSWDQVVDLYGDSPVILGLNESCHRLDHITLQPRVAGMYHTGTNALARLLMQQDPARQQSASSPNYRDYDAPYGKHAPYAFHKRVELLDNMLIITLIRDPFRWMRKMCRVRYDATWDRSHPHRCPNLVKSLPTTRLENGSAIVNSSTYTTFPVTVQIVGSVASNQTKKPELPAAITYPSLADWWSTWNRDYYQATSAAETGPRRLMIRFEDLLFFAPQVLAAIRDCIGWSSANSSRAKEHARSSSLPNHLLGAAKDHGWSSDMVSALIQYGTTQGRHKGLARVDKEYVQTALDAELMNVFHYPQVPLL
jgi:hypothetical protein